MYVKYREKIMKAFSVEVEHVYMLCVEYTYFLSYYYYYRYSALGPVWAETRAQSGDWYGSSTLHPGQFLRGSLPLLSPVFRRPPRRERS